MPLLQHSDSSGFEIACSVFCHLLCVRLTAKSNPCKSQHRHGWTTSLSSHFPTFHRSSFQVESRIHHYWEHEARKDGNGHWLGSASTNAPPPGGWAWESAWRRPRWVGSETGSHFVSDRLAVPLTDAPVHGCLPELACNTLGTTGSVTRKVRSQGSNVVKSERYRKFRRDSASRSPSAPLAGGRLYDADNDADVCAYGGRVPGTLASPLNPPSRAHTSLLTVRGRGDARSAAQLP